MDENDTNSNSTVTSTTVLLTTSTTEIPTTAVSKLLKRLVVTFGLTSLYLVSIIESEKHQAQGKSL